MPEHAHRQPPSRTTTTAAESHRPRARRTLSKALCAAVLPFLILVLPAVRPANATPDITVRLRTDTLFNNSTNDLGSIVQGRRILTAVTLTNEGTTPLTITSATVEAPFQIILDPAPEVQPRRRTAIRIILPDTAPAGVHNAALRIQSNDPTTPVFTSTLRVEVIPLVPHVEVSLGATPVFNNSTVVFGSAVVGLPVTRTMFVTNAGNANLTVSVPQVITGTGFEALLRRDAVLRPGRKIAFPIRMNASSVGPLGATFRFGTNDPNLSAFTFTLTGSVQEPSPNVQVFEGGLAVFQGELVPFGVTEPGRPVVGTFTIANRGRQNLVIGPVVADGQGFTILNQPPSTIRPGRAVRFRIRMDALSADQQPNAVIRFTTNAPGVPEFAFTATGTVGIPAPDIRVSQAGAVIQNGGSFSFGMTGLNVAASRTFLIQNTGTAPLTLGNIDLTGTGFTLVGSSAANSVPPGGATEFTVQLQSAAPLNASGTVAFINNVPGESPFVFGLTGEVAMVVPMPEVQVLLSGTNIPVGGLANLGNSFVGFPLSRTFTIRNLGDAPLTVGTVTTTGVGFSITAQPASPVAPGGSTSFVVQATSASVAERFGSVSFPNNDADENPFTFVVRATFTQGTRSFILRDLAGQTVPHNAILPSIAASDGDIILTDFSIANTGDLPLTVNSITPMGAGYASTTPADPIPTMDRAFFTVSFNSTGLAGINPNLGTISIDTNSDVPPNPYVFSIRTVTLDWFAAGGGADDTVRAVLSIPSSAGLGATAVYAAGDFTNVNNGGTPAARIARFTPGGPWAALPGGGTDGPINALALHDDDGTGPNPTSLFAAGAFTTAGGNPANSIAKWNGATWLPLGSGVNGPVHAMIVHDADGDGPGRPLLYVGGEFSTAGGLANTSRIARWNGSSWEPLAGGGIAVGTVFALASFNDAASGTPPKLFVAGSFNNVGAANIAASRIARWNGTAWLPVGAGINTGDDIRTLAVFDPDGPSGPAPASLVAGGLFTRIGNVDANSIARWSGTAWFPLAGGFNGRVRTLTVFDEDGPFNSADNTLGPNPPVLIAGGDFTMSGDNLATLNRVARWNGLLWRRVGLGVNGPVFALNPSIAEGVAGSRPRRVIVGGSFSDADGNFVVNIAAWGASAP